MLPKSLALAVTALSAMAFQATAQDFADPQKGQTFARMVCAECHSVTATPALSPNSNAPAFAIVANTPGMTATALRTWLQTSHPTMPNIVLRSDDRDNVIAYILSLNTKSKGL